MTVITNDYDGRSRPYQIRPGASALFAFITSPKTIVREMVSNALDQYLYYPDKEPLVVIGISKSRKKFYCRDWATGVLNKKDFMFTGNEDLDGYGKVVGNTKSDMTNIVDSLFLGQYHIAKQSFRNASNNTKGEMVRIYSYSNGWTETLENGETKYHPGYGRILSMYKYGWGPEDEELEWREPAQKECGLDAEGMMVEILNPKPILLDRVEIVKMLSLYFGIRIARNNVKIIVHDLDTDEKITVQKPRNLKTDNEVKADSILQLVSGHFVTCRIDQINEPTDKPNIEIYVKYVFIKEIHVNWLCRGWINCNALTTELDLSRESFKVSDTFDEVLSKLDAYLETEKYIRQERRKGTIKCESLISVYASLSQTLGSQMFQGDHPMFTGDPDKNLPPNPSELEGTEPQKKDVGKRNKHDPPIVHKPPLHPCPKGMIWDKKLNKCVENTRKPPEPTITHPVNRPGGTDKNTPKIEVIIGDFGANSPVVYFSQAEILNINTDRKSWTILAGAEKHQIKRVAFPMLAKASLDYYSGLGDKIMDIGTYKNKYEELLEKMADAKDIDG